MTSNTPTPPPLLGAYAATRCPRRTHNDFDKTIPRLLGEIDVSPEVQGRIDAGIAFETSVRAQIAADLAEQCLDLTDRELFGSAAVAATVAAMNDGVLVILGGQLPDDVESGRRGRPDALVRFGPAPTVGSGDRATYLPVDIKSHKVLADARGTAPPARISSMQRPSLADSELHNSITGRKHERDALQLAHYWRMLQACGRAPLITAVGGIIGTDDLAIGPVVLWHDLELAVYKTYSRSSDEGHTLRTAMSRYDHEFEFRSDIAAVARERTGRVNGPLPLVAPVRVRECDDCPWFDYCMSELGDDDASARIGRLSAREWLALRKIGYQSVAQVADLNLDVIAGRSQFDEFDNGQLTGNVATTQTLLDQYLPEVSHLQNARVRLRDAVITAQMVLDGTHLRRLTSGPVEIPRADVEIDFDIENDRSARVYLWGIFVTDHVTGESGFDHTTSWEELDAESEARLAARFWLRLNAIVDAARNAGKSVRIYHYSTPEPNNLLRIATDGLDPDLPSVHEVSTLIDDAFVDMYPIMRENYFGRDGLGLKVAASRGAGFSWRDEDPGGLQSITWLEQVRAGESQLKQRVLEYNEDDVRATLALRTWLDRQA